MMPTRTIHCLCQERFFRLDIAGSSRNTKGFHQTLSASTASRRRHRSLGRFISSTSRSLSTMPLHTSSSYGKVVDLRSDTVTSPTHEMLKTAMSAPTGDDVLGEDPTVLQLQEYMSQLFHKDAALFVPTGTMSNLLALIAHCCYNSNGGSEVIIGTSSHISWWEGGGASSLGGIHTRQLQEDSYTAQLSIQDIRDAYRDDSDDHCAQTQVVCLENTHNLLGGVSLSPSYTTSVKELLHELDPTRHQLALHVDGARIFHAALAQQVSVSELTSDADSVSVCLSKGLGAPLGSVLVGSTETIRRAKRARKRVGGGMRQAGVVASMGLHALQHHVNRLIDDHSRAQRLGYELLQRGFEVPLRNGQIDTNIVYFALPATSKVTRDEFLQRLAQEYGVKVSSGYHSGGRLFRAVTHLDVNDHDIERAVQAMTKVALG